MHVDRATELLTAVLYGKNLEAIGRRPASLIAHSPRAATASTTVTLNGYDSNADRCWRLEATIALTWSVDVPTDAVDVAGTAFLTDPEQGTIVRFEALRRHPFNRLRTG